MCFIFIRGLRNVKKMLSFDIKKRGCVTKL